MGVAAQHQVEIRMGREPINLRRVGEQDGHRAAGNVLRRAVKVLQLIIMRIVDAGEVDHIAANRDPRPFVEQQSVAHCLHRRDHADAVVIAEDRVDGSVDVGAQTLEPREGVVAGAMRFRAIVAGQHAQIVT